VDIKNLQASHQHLSAVVDRLVELEDIEPELELEILPPLPEVDGCTPHQDYCGDCEVCPGMKW
jgi:hypothetical protein